MQTARRQPSHSFKASGKKRHPVQVAPNRGISALLGHDEFISLITWSEKAKTLELFHNVAERRRTMQNGDLSSRSFCCWYSKDLNHFHVARLRRAAFRLICSY